MYLKHIGLTDKCLKLCLTVSLIDRQLEVEVYFAVVVVVVERNERANGKSCSFRANKF